MPPTAAAAASARLTREAPDLRRAIPRQAWLASRAANALRRPVFILAVGVGTFVTALISMVVMLRAQRHAPPPTPVQARPDTLTVAADIALSRTKLLEADSTLAAMRADAAAVARATPAPDSAVLLVDPAVRDSLLGQVRRLEALIARAEQAPLPSSYKALADAPEMRSESRVRALLDTLADIEREREGFGAGGGVDPIFVALTSRANDVGRAISSIARERRAALLARVPPASAASQELVTAPAAAPDSAAILARRDSIRQAVDARDAELDRLRAATLAMDREEKLARERANAVAPPLALLASAFVLSWAFGFAVALIGELRTPRVSNEYELERFLGVRVLSSVEANAPSTERGRREADRAAPPYFDPHTEGYQLAYLGLALEQPTLLVATVTGDDPVISAVVTCNLAAVAVDEARNTLIIDLQDSGSAAKVLRARESPGVTDILRAGLGWADATTTARIGRHKTVDLVPAGRGAPPSTADLHGLLKRDYARLARYYDAIFVHAGSQDVSKGLSTALPSPEIIYCAQPGVTPLRPLRSQLELIRSSGGAIQGVVLWETERPVLPDASARQTREEIRADRHGAEASEAQTAASA